MDIIDGIIWVSTGFIPMLGGLGLVWRLARETKGHPKTEGAHVFDQTTIRI